MDLLGTYSLPILRISGVHCDTKIRILRQLRSYDNIIEVLVLSEHEVHDQVLGTAPAGIADPGFHRKRFMRPCHHDKFL